MVSAGSALRIERSLIGVRSHNPVAYTSHQMLKLRINPGPRYLLKSNHALPTVDILIICNGQEPSIVMDTVIATARLDWPIDKFRVCEDRLRGLRECVAGAWLTVLNIDRDSIL